MTSQTRVSAFDIRLIIALLTGVYGLVLLVLGLFITSDEEIKKSAGVNINLWTGVGLVIICALFGVWARVRPIRVPVEQNSEQSSEQSPEQSPEQSSSEQGRERAEDEPAGPQ